MSQFSLTQGGRHLPAHSRILGYGKSYQKNLTDNEKIAHDEDVVAVSAIFWSLWLSAMPMEVTSPVVKALEDVNLPRMASNHVPPGDLFLLN